MHINTAALAVACYATAIGAQTPDAARGDTIVLSRRAAIGAALRSNPQLEIGREQTAQARARSVSAVAIPDPVLTYSLDNQPGFLQLGNAGETSLARQRHQAALHQVLLVGGQVETGTVLQKLTQILIVQRRHERSPENTRTSFGAI